ncbi:MAG: hypothetical protein ACRC4Y_08025, partial [Cetobacterium sp.]
MIYILVVAIGMVLFFYIKSSKKSKYTSRVRVRGSNVRVPQHPEVTVRKNVVTSQKIEPEKEEISEDYKKIIFYTVDTVSNLLDIPKITAIKMGFNLKTGEFIRLEEFQNTDKEAFKIFSNDVKHFVTHNVKL